MIPVFICTGFLDSGKTTLVKETLMEQEWIEDGRTLLLVCEEGEEEYSEEYLREKNMVMLEIEEFEQLNTTFFQNCEKNFRPVQVVIEYNGMWNLEDLLYIQFPKNWELQGVYSTVDGSTLEMYLKNMKNILMEQLVESELIIVNRCTDSVDRASFRRSLKVQNPNAQVIFESVDGTIIQPTAEDLPYDVKGDKIVLADEDFGIWFVDTSEHPEWYLHKEIELTAQAVQTKQMSKDSFVLVRKIMTCCADDVGIYGYCCKSPEPVNIVPNQWLKVRARFEYEPLKMFEEAQPVLYLLDMEPTQKPKVEIVSL